MTDIQNPKHKIMPDVRYVVAVASGKGGVGKSTLSVNLATALSAAGHKVGLLDADVYGPSIPTLLNIQEKPVMGQNGRIEPIEKFGLKVMSTGFFLPSHEAVVWRGPMLHKMIQDLLAAVNWGQLDYLIVDLPPGTGDVQLSLCQTIGITGAVIVSTPQDVAWQVAQKAIVMFDKLNTPVLGVVENMSGYRCTSCGHEEDIFARGAAQSAAKALGLDFFGTVPILSAIRIDADKATPACTKDSSHSADEYYQTIAKALTTKVSNLSNSTAQKISLVKILKADANNIELQWSDGRQSTFAPSKLRLLCPCAACVNEDTGQRIIKAEQIQPGIQPVTLNAVGSYALQISWSDGHGTGLYSFDLLRKNDSTPCAR